MPDLTALGKVIGGGLPVGAFGGRRDIMDCLSPDGPVYQAGTLSRKSAGDGGRAGAVARTRSAHGWERLEEIGAAFERGVREACASAGKNYTFHRIGSCSASSSPNGRCAISPIR